MKHEWECVCVNTRRKSAMRVKRVACTTTKKNTFCSNKVEKCIVSTKARKPALCKTTAQTAFWQKALQCDNRRMKTKLQHIKHTVFLHVIISPVCPNGRQVVTVKICVFQTRKNRQCGNLV